MNTVVKKAAPKKKPQARSLIKYAERSLKPKPGYVVHPLHHNSPDSIQVFSRKQFKVHTGLEIAIPPNMVLITSCNIDGAVQANNLHFGYQKELTLDLINMTDSMIEVDSHQIVGAMFLSEIKGW